MNLRTGSLLLAALLAAMAQQARAELTFFTCSDTHYNEAVVSNTVQAGLVDLMNGLPGKEYPADLGGGAVAAPRGVIVPGDLIDDGQGPAAMIRQEWTLWNADFGLAGEGRLKFPVYEGYGNHDLNGRFYVEDEIKARNLKRADVVNIASNGYHYAWEWDGIHFIQLNLYPGTVRPAGVGGQPPRHALEFLKEDLAKHVGASGRPVIVSHHYMPTDGWWSDPEKAAYREALRPYNVILVIHGHQGSASITDWMGLTLLDNHHFARTGVFVVNIRGDELRIAQRLPAGTWGLNFKKTFSRTLPTSAPAPAPAAPAP